MKEEALELGAANDGLDPPALHKQENQTQGNSQPHEADSFSALVGNQSMVCDGQGHARAQQQGGVDGGQPKRRHGLKRLDDARR